MFEFVNYCRDNTANFALDNEHEKCQKQLIRVLELLIDMMLKAMQN